MYTRKEECLRYLKITEEKPAQLLNLRWQAVGITIALISAFLGITISTILSDNQDLGVAYLSIFSGSLFSIIFLFVWRYINHLITDEEALYQKGIFINKKLLEIENLDSYSDKKFRDTNEEIENTEFKIVLLEQCLLNEFDHFSSSKFPLNDEYYKLNNSQKLILSKKLDYKRFESGQWKFDCYSIIIIEILFLLGLWLLITISNYTSSNNNFFRLFKEIIPAYPSFIIYFFTLLFFILFFLKKYTIPNFILPSTNCRLEKIRNLICELNKDTEV